MADGNETMSDLSKDTNRDTNRDIYKTLDLSLRIGEVLLSSGAGAADVGATMLNVAHGCGLRGATADVTFTELAMSHQTSYDEPSMMQIRQVRHREWAYARVPDSLHRPRAERALQYGQAPGSVRRQPQARGSTCAPG